MRKIVIVLAIVALVVIIGSGAWIYAQYGNPANPTPTPTPEPTAPQVLVRDSAIAYIQANHTDAAQYLTDLNWSGGRATPEGLVGAETYIYTSGNWNLTIQYPVIPNPIYTINATYTSTDISIIWHGTSENGIITETDYAKTP